MVRKYSLAAAGATVLMTMAATIGAATATGGPVLDLRLNEQAGATTALDSSGLQHHGAIGSHVVMNGQYARFDRHPPSEGIPYGFDHVIAVPDAADDSPDPGSGNFSVEIRYRTSESFGIVLRKGQSKSSGGQVKFSSRKER
jgi:hypothetical protein